MASAATRDRDHRRRGTLAARRARHAGCADRGRRPGRDGRRRRHAAARGAGGRAARHPADRRQYRPARVLTEVETTGDGLNVLEASSPEPLPSTSAWRCRHRSTASARTSRSTTLSSGVPRKPAWRPSAFARRRADRRHPLGWGGRYDADRLTAYFLSAGGPIVSLRCRRVRDRGAAPHTLFARPLIVPTSSTVKITCDSEIAHANPKSTARSSRISNRAMG